jgi:outer membrane protein OmpA-like peptidoglycan-associated protein
MAELDVQPKTKRRWWIWLLLLLIILAVVFYLISREGNGGLYTGTDSTAHSGSKQESGLAAETVTTPNWGAVDFNAPQARYEEITDSAVSVRGNDDYSIYGLGENILFATGASTVQAGAENQLKQISSSLEKRFKGASLAVYGNTDSTGNAGENKALGKERAVAVKEWLVANGGIDSGQISVQSKGQSDPVASNSTSKGRQMNRRVEIVAMSQPAR